MTIDVRTFRPQDAAAVAEVRRQVLPCMVGRPESVRWEVERAPAALRATVLVAEVDGRIVGATEAGLAHASADPGACTAVPLVLPGHRRRGVGAALLAAAERHLRAAGGRTLYVWASDGGDAPGFAERRGFRRGRSSHFLRRDLGVPLPAPPRLPPGTRLCTAEDLAADRRGLYEADTECALDEPGDVPGSALGFEEWCAAYWDRPEFEPALSGVVLVGGEVAAYSIAHTDGRDRFWSGMTGTRRAHRGQGLARAAKHEALRLAAVAGYRSAFTGNDAGNAPMLAVNRWFGYTRAATEWRYVREL
ncbi:GNAT family N-acetyltransferase [Streptomyces sp. 549]|uniref:GNAT family N-acetyltransferase n=1 Tax=Streptomyces sp. 549 TaxID=3049076 RepID=UPI0024C25C5F|nr:GNAT family N-acetyltransferase [Streptomyces sp. 549]MDK1475683.1 GNAT family N-acetyltransferase [Streptomyces sp. 549]